MRRTHLPIANPCHEDWDAMDRVARGRFCQSCDKQVFDLSSMSEPEARDVLEAHRGARICVRYCHDAAGNVKFRPAAPPRVAAVAALAAVACTPHQPERHREVMGDIAPAPVAHEPEAELMGKLEAVPPEPDPEPVVEVKGEIPAEPDPDAVTELMGDVDILAEPCDPPKTPPDAAKGPSPARRDLVRL